MNINIKYLLFIFLITINLINCHIIQYGKEFEFDDLSSKEIEIYNSNSKKLLFVNGGNGTYHLIDSQVFEIIGTFNFKEEQQLQVIGKSAYFDEINDNFYIVLSLKNKSKSILYKLDNKFSVISSLDIQNDIVSPNQLYTLNLEQSTGIITFIGENGIHRFEYEGNSTKLYGDFMYKNNHRGFKLSSISFNDNILYISGRNDSAPVIMKFYLSHYGSGKRVQYLDSTIKLNPNIVSVSNLLVYKKAITFISLQNNHSGILDLLNVYGFDNAFKIGVKLNNVKCSASDNNHIGLYILDGSKESYGGRDLIFAVSIKEEDYRRYVVKIVSMSYYRKGTSITGVYYVGDNRFMITTNTNSIQMIEVDSTKPSKDQIVPYSQQPGNHYHYHNKQNYTNKWWRILFATVFTGIGLILCCAMVSLYIFIKKRDVIIQFLKSNGLYKDKDNADNNNDSSSSQFATTILFDKYQKLDSNINNDNASNDDEKIDIDSNGATDNNNNNNNSNNDNNNESSTSSTNNNNNSSDNNNNNNNNKDIQQSYQL